MLPLSERLQGIVTILENDDKKLMAGVGAAGYLAYPPGTLAKTILKLLDIAAPTKVSLDLGCGNGGWALLVAAAGFPSYGIELNHELLAHAKQNYKRAVSLGFIDPAVTCKLIHGDMIPPRQRPAYAAFLKRHQEVEQSMPQSGERTDRYLELGCSIATADIIYCWSWPTQSRFLYNMLGQEAKEDAIFVLPSYVRYTQGEHMNASMKEKNELLLVPLCEPVADVFVGKRAMD